MHPVTHPWFSFLELWHVPFIGRLLGSSAGLVLLFALAWLVLIALAAVVAARSGSATAEAGGDLPRSRTHGPGPSLSGPAAER